MPDRRRGTSLCLSRMFGITSSLMDRLGDQAVLQTFQPVFGAVAAFLYAAERRSAAAMATELMPTMPDSIASPISIARLPDSVKA